MLNISFSQTVTMLYSNDNFFDTFFIYVILVFAFEGVAVPNFFVCEVEKPGLFLEKWDI